MRRSRSTFSKCTAPSRASRRSPATCLLARRLVERGVRFVEIFHEAWDQHGNLTHDIKENCATTDQACAALVKDLKQRGLLDDTLVIWGGEFGRTPMVQGGGNDGRDHHPNCFTMWLAGGGIKPGVTLGESDDFGFNADERSRPRARFARHDSASTWLRPTAFFVQVAGTRPTIDRRRTGAGREGNLGVAATCARPYFGQPLGVLAGQELMTRWITSYFSRSFGSSLFWWR